MESAAGGKQAVPYRLLQPKVGEKFGLASILSDYLHIRGGS